MVIDRLRLIRRILSGKQIWDNVASESVKEHQWTLSLLILSYTHLGFYMGVLTN